MTIIVLIYEKLRKRSITNSRAQNHPCRKRKTTLSYTLSVFIEGIGSLKLANADECCAKVTQADTRKRNG